MKDIKDRIKDAFADDDREGVRQYVEWLRAALSDVSANLRRTVLLLLALIAVFEFVVESQNSAYVIAGFRVDRGSIVLQFIPALVAYLYLQAVVNTSVIRQLDAAFTLTLEKWSSRVVENDLDLLIGPDYPLFWTPFRSKRLEGIYPGGRMVNMANGFIGFAIFIGVLIFEVQAYFVQLPKPSASALNYISWAASMFIATFCLGMAQLCIKAEVDYVKP